MCEFFELDANIRTVGGAGVAVAAGGCYLEPPAMHLIPVPVAPKSIVDVRSDGSQQMTLVPQPIERVVLNTRHACARFCPRVGSGDAQDKAPN
jgi:hypothetical protein